MSEGDTIHRLAARLQESLAGRRIDAARAPSPRSPLHRGATRLTRLEGLRVEAASARGKHLLLEFESRLWLRSHLRMSGAWHLYRDGERWRRPERRAWLVLAADGVEAVQFDGPELELGRGAPGSNPRLARLGPDVLAPGFEAESAVASMRRAGAHIELGEALLDQSLIAGVGNVYKSEALHRAGLDPWRRLGDLSDDELSTAVESATALMTEGLRTGRRAKGVYKAAGRPCPRCGSAIRSRGQGDDNRTTYWCAACQR
jgi:endonuclease-8